MPGSYMIRSSGRPLASATPSAHSSYPYRNRRYRSRTRKSNNRSVMPLDVLGCTRATLEGSACFHSWRQSGGNTASPATLSTLKRVGNHVNSLRDRDRALQLLPLNEEFPVSASHQLALITSLPFVHTARRYYRLNG